MNDMLALIGPLIPALRRYARALTRDGAVADDLVQDCLERAIAGWHQRRHDGDARSWVFTILHNLAVNAGRRKTRRGFHHELGDVDEELLSRHGDQEDRLRLRDLARALDTLPEEQRAVLLLVSVEDLSYAEAARVLDIPLGTVMSRLARAREKVLNFMEGDAVVVSAAPGLRRVK